MSWCHFHHDRQIVSSLCFSFSPFLSIFLIPFSSPPLRCCACGRECEQSPLRCPRIRPATLAMKRERGRTRTTRTTRTTRRRRRRRIEKLHGKEGEEEIRVGGSENIFTFLKHVFRPQSPSLSPSVCVSCLPFAFIV